MGAPADHGAESSVPGDDAGLDQETALRGILSQEPLLLGFVRAIVGSRTLEEDIFQTWWCW